MYPWSLSLKSRFKPNKIYDEGRLIGCIEASLTEEIVIGFYLVGKT